MNIDPDLLSDDLSSAMGTETLLACDLVPEGLPAPSKGPAEQQIRHIGGVSESFRELIHTIAPALDDFMVSSATTIRNWILKLFES